MGFLSGISIVCFASGYALTLALEVTRLFFRLPVRLLFIISLAAAAWVAHTLYLWMQATHPAGTALSSWYHWYLIVAWVLASFYLVQLLRRPNFAAGLFTLPVILGLLALGYAARDLAPFPRQQATLVWGWIHGVALLLGTVAVSIGFVAGIMYLVQAWRLKHKLLPRQGLQLPSLESLHRANERALISSAVLLAAGLLSGFVVSLVRSGSVSWRDPVVWTSGVLFIWVVAAALFNGFYLPARQGRKVAYLTIALFLFLALVLALTLFGPSGHGRLDTDPPPSTEEGP